jgi:hypothetical protein
MRMALHIFRKDMRLLWPFVLLAVALQAALALQDRWRSDWTPGAAEGWLNVLLPLAWAIVAALAVEQEPLAGDSQFWITRPYRRSSLFAAKALFVLLAIHVPAFLADAWILGARGFPPLANLGSLLIRQIEIAGAITLPAMALAAVARNHLQFLFAAVLVPSSILLLNESVRTPWIPVDRARTTLTILVLAVAAIAILWLQYRRRRTLVSRTVGAAAAIAAGLWYAFAGPAYTFALRSTFSPSGSDLALHLDTGPRVPNPAWGAGTWPTVAIPISISGVPAGSQVRLELLRTRVTAPGGAPSVLEAYVSPEGAWLFLRFDSLVSAKLRNGPSRISGEAGATLYRTGRTTWMPVGTAQAVPDVGRCRSMLQEARYARSMLKVECEAPGSLPSPTRVRLWDPASGEDWKAALGDSATMVPGPRYTWLSPLDRRQTFFQLAGSPRGAGSRWLVPLPAIGGAKIAMTPELASGRTVVHYDLPDVDMRKFLIARAGNR